MESLKLTWVFTSYHIIRLLWIRQFTVWENITVTMLTWEQNDFHIHFNYVVDDRQEKEGNLCEHYSFCWMRMKHHRIRLFAWRSEKWIAFLQLTFQTGNSTKTHSHLSQTPHSDCWRHGSWISCHKICCRENNRSIQPPPSWKPTWFSRVHPTRAPNNPRRIKPVSSLDPLPTLVLTVRFITFRFTLLCSYLLLFST